MVAFSRSGVVGFFFIGLLLGPIGALWGAGTLVAVAFKDSPLQLHLDFIGERPKIKTFKLHKPERVVIDLMDARAKVQWQRIALPSKAVRKIRGGNPNSHTLRIVLEITAPIQPNVMIHPLKAGTKRRITVSLSSDNPHQLVVKTQPINVKQAPLKASLRDVVVIIDPGHGGKDPGAIGPWNIQEKAVVLAIAKNLQTIINRQIGMKAVLTRKGDYYIGLRERMQIARRTDADVFVAIHADAFKNHESNGASVFALSQIGATSEAARWLAEKENYSELGGVNLSQLDDQTGVVRSVLIDLSQTATIGASVHMGERILKSIGEITRLHNKKVEQARFVVLKSPDIPSVLVETGFISNPKEARNLNNSRYQKRIAKAVFKGIKDYFWEFPPYGSRVEMLSSAKTHVVKRGDTLSGLVARYRAPMKSIQRLNNLSSTKLRVGQILVIPSTWA